MLGRLIALVPWQAWAGGVAALVLVAGVVMYRLEAAAYDRGYKAAVADVAAQTRKTQADLFKAADALSIESARVEAQRADLDQRQEEFANAARHDPNAASRIPDPRDLRALAAEWAGAAR